MNQVATAFDDIVDTYYRAWFRYHPEAAVDAGVEGYAHLLTPVGEARRGALVCLNDELRVELEELDTGKLDADRVLDLTLLQGALQVENQGLLDIEPRQPHPGHWLPVNAIYQLTIRPVAGFEAALRARLEAIPAHLRAAQDDLRPQAARIPLPWLQSAATESRQGAGFVRGLPQHPKLAAIAELEQPLARAAQALVEYADFLENELVPGPRAISLAAVRFETLLQQRHFLDVGTDALYAFGQELVERTRRELAVACREVFGTNDLRAALARLRASHPSKQTLLATYRAQMQAARAFVCDRNLMSVPAAEQLEVVETPTFLRHQIPFAAYCEPAPNDPVQHGYYYVTPPSQSDAQGRASAAGAGSAEVAEEELAEHDNIGLMHTCVHEAWPGHHLQFVTANLNPAARRRPRLLNASATFYEGWALYSEQLMHEQGFLNRPESRVILLRDRLWRALRILIDIEIHTRDVSLETAADRLVTELGFPRSQALAELTWYSQAPTVPLGYATGWALINALREHLRRGPQPLPPKIFHDKLLSVGSVALPLVIRHAFGEPAWCEARQRVFGGVA